MYLDYRRLREEQVMRQSGVPCACGQRLWTREQVREPGRRRFMCLACRTVLNVPADLFQSREPQAAEGQPSESGAKEAEHHGQQQT
jgi:hypothetical protein